MDAAARFARLTTGDPDGVPVSDVSTRLLRALRYAELGRWEEARADCAAAIEASPRAGVVRLVAGWCAEATGDYEVAVARFREAAGLQPRGAETAHAARHRCAARVGWMREAIAAAEDAASAGHALRWNTARLHLLAGRADDVALQVGRAAIAEEPSAASARLELAGVCARLGLEEEAVRHVEAIDPMRTGELPLTLERLRVLRECGAWDALDRALVRARASWKAPQVALVAARLHLWRGEPDEAEAIATREEGRDRGTHAKIMAGVSALQGDWHAVRTSLEGGELDADARCLLAEARMRTGADAMGTLTEAVMSADGFPLAAWILRVLESLRTGPGSEAPRVGIERTAEAREGVEALVPGAGEVLDRGVPEEVREVFEAALAAMRGNRSATPTAFDGTLRRLRVSGPRTESRRVLHRVSVCAPAEVVPRFAEVIARFPRSALPVCHRGELRLWMGDLEAAREDFEEAIRICAPTRYAYIGLMGVALLEGRPEVALEEADRGTRAMRGTTGPALFAYRGEARWRRGDPEGGLADLEEALRLRPSRLGARVARVAMTGVGLGELPIALLSDAATARGRTLDPDTSRVEAAVAKELAEEALRMLRGNRSSTEHTYFAKRWKTLATGGADEPTDAVGRARGVLRRAMGLAKPPPSRPRVRVTGPVLDDAALRRFEEQGYVVVRGAIDPRVAQAWVDDANRRLARDPARWVKQYDPENAGRSLVGYRADDPSTWTWERLDLEGERSTPWAELAPEAWAAIAQLVGGEARVATPEVSNYFVVNFRATAPDGSPWKAPSREASSWHVDAPRVDMKLEEMRAGLVAMLFFSSTPTRSGAPFVAPGSHRLVADAITAAGEEGADFVDRAAGPRIAARCERFVELTGEIGDVALLHPLLLHSSSPNPSGRIRWLGNPMVMLRTPWRADGESPVERAVFRSDC